MQLHRVPRVVQLLFGVALAATLMALLVAASGCASSSASATPGAPTPTPTTQERIAALARHALGSNVQHIASTYGPGDGTATVTATLGGSVPVADADVSAMQERVKAMCFQTQEALWTSSIALHSVTVTIVGPIMDQYAEREIQAYGAVTLTAATVAKFAWGTLSPDAAWEQYDNAYLRSGYYDVD